MTVRSRPHPRPRTRRLGLVLGAVVTLVAVSGLSATAASKITSAQIKDGTIQSRDLSPSLRSKIAAPGVGAITTQKITTVNGPVVTYPKDFALTGGTVPTSLAQCPSGAVAINGWLQITSSYYTDPTPFVSSSRPTGFPDLWSVNLSYSTSIPDDVEFRAVALCAGP